MIDNKVTPVEECPMCGEESIRLTNICPINNTDHKICTSCIKNLREKYDKEFCAYCGERPVIINKPVTVNPGRDSINIVIEPTREETPFRDLRKKHQWFLYMIGGIVCYIGLILNWHLYRMLDHFMEEGKTLNEEIDWHIYNAFYALCIDTCLVFFIAYICENR